MTTAQARLDDSDDRHRVERWPRPTEPSSHVGGQPRRSTRARRLGVVLIVDDTMDTRELYALYFRSLGFTVMTADDGEAGIAAAAAQRPDVIVMDLSMPRLDGISAMRRLKADRRSRDIPIILLTGYPERAIGGGAVEAGAAVFLTKPCLPEDLETHVRRLLGTSDTAK